MQKEICSRMVDSDTCRAEGRYTTLVYTSANAALAAAKIVSAQIIAPTSRVYQAVAITTIDRVAAVTI